jgi:predicted nuclease of predicted toxin-antitoxin system
MRDGKRFIWSTVGKVTAPDSEVMTCAATNDYVVLTHDLDFSAILAATHGEKPSVVQIRDTEVSPAVIGPIVIAALRHTEFDLEAGALVTVDSGRIRVRLLQL